jgi:hypothetical protein
VNSSKVRQILLGLTALVFVGIAAGSLVAPDTMARGLGYSLDNVDARSEFRAIYVGVWLATAFLMVVALRNVQQALLGDLCALLVLGQVFGRIISVVLDGFPSARIWPFFIVETIGGLALLAVRPSKAPD